MASQAAETEEKDQEAMVCKRDWLRFLRRWREFVHATQRPPISIALDAIDDEREAAVLMQCGDVKRRAVRLVRDYKREDG